MSDGCSKFKDKKYKESVLFLWLQEKLENTVTLGQRPKGRKKETMNISVELYRQDILSFQKL